MRTLLVANRPDQPRFENSMTNAIITSGDVDVIELADGWDLPLLAEYSAVVFFVKFRQLREQQNIDWQGFSGPRVLLDHDSFHDYGGWWGSPHIGEWTQHVPRLGFTSMIVSGESSRGHFTRLGLRTEVMHKGYSPEHFMDLGLARSSLGHFGSPYGARQAMLRRVRKAGIVVDDVAVPYNDLNLALNLHLGILVCNMPAQPRFGLIGRAVQKVTPGALMRVGQAPEPMAKNFEAAAAGCAVFMDEAPDLEYLGFIDGQTAIIYNDFDDLMDKMRFWLDRPEDLRRIGEASAHLCLDRHTWKHRAERFHAIIQTFAQDRGA